MLFFELLQVAMGHRQQLSLTPSASEWHHLYQMAEQHALIGVCYAGVLRLPQPQWPPEDLLIDWIWQAQRIKEQNALVWRRSIEVCRKLQADGYNTCLLKGQGTARLYGELDALRQPGDIDIWVTPKERPYHHPKQRIISYVRKQIGRTDLRYHHIDYPIFDDVDVEVHFIPICLNNPFLNRHLKAWYRGQHEVQMHHQVEINGEQITLPTKEFNLLYNLLHIYKHIFEEGVGLRQLMDYYYVLVGELGVSKSHYWSRHWELAKLIRMLKLETLAGAVMYVMKEVFAMPDEYLICEVNRRAGISLLSEIMQSGNFGLFDTRYDKSDSGRLNWGAQWHRYVRKTKRSLSLSWYFPHEGLWEPWFRLYHFFWRRLKLWRI